MDKTTSGYLEMRNQIVELLKKGLKNYVIRRELDIIPYDFDIYLKDIKTKGIMTRTRN